MTRAAGLAKDNVFVLGVADLANGGVAVFVHLADFTGRQANLRVTLIPRHQSGRRAGGPNHLSAAAGYQLDIMNRQTHRNGAQRKAVSEFGWRGRAAHQLGAHLQTVRRDDIDFLAVSVLEQRQARSAPRIVLDRHHRGFNAVLRAFDIYEPDLLFVPTANAARSNTTVGVAPTGPLARLHQTFLWLALCNVAEIRIREITRR